MGVIADRWLTALQAMLPPGAALTREPGAVLTRVLSAIAAMFGAAQERLESLRRQSSEPLEASDMLPDWERLLALPDKCMTAQTRQLPPGWYPLYSAIDLLSYARAAVSAAYYDALGVLRYASAGVPRYDHDPMTLSPRGLLIEAAATNSFTNTDAIQRWTNLARVTAIQGAALAPDGTMTAVKCVPTIDANNHQVANGNVACPGGSNVIVSFYLKAAGYNVVRVRLSDNVGLIDVGIDLNTGGFLFGTTSAASVEQCQGGWYRCSLRWTTDAAATIIAGSVWIYPNGQAADPGNGADGVLLWGPQLVIGDLVPSSYIKSPAVFTGRAGPGSFCDVSGVLQTAAMNVARYDFDPVTHVSKGLLLEAAATNMLRSSSDFRNTAEGNPISAWTQYVDADTQVSNLPKLTPDGGVTCSKLQFATAVAGSARQITQTIAGAVDNTVYVASIHASPAEIAALALIGTCKDSTYPEARFNLLTKSVIARNPTILALGIEDAPMGFVRLWVAFDVKSGGGNAGINIRLWSPTNTAPDGVAGDGCWLYGAQAELGFHPTSYIATTTAAVTRAADVSTSTAGVRGADVATVEVVQSIDERRRFASQRLLEQGGQSRAYFVALADSLGEPDVTISEFRPFTCTDDCDDALYSESDRFTWRVNVPRAAGGVRAMNCGDHCESPLQFSVPSLIECPINERRPAHTEVIFAYAP